MNIIIWLIVGALVGWVASMIVGTKQSIVSNVMIGIVGAFLAGQFLTPLFGIGAINQNDLSFPALMVSLLGAIILLSIAHVPRQELAR